MRNVPKTEAGPLKPCVRPARSSRVQRASPPLHSHTHIRPDWHTSSKWYSPKQLRPPRLVSKCHGSSMVAHQGEAQNHAQHVQRVGVLPCVLPVNDMPTAVDEVGALQSTKGGLHQAPRYDRAIHSHEAEAVDWREQRTYERHHECAKAVPPSPQSFWRDRHERTPRDQV